MILILMTGLILLAGAGFYLAWATESLESTILLFIWGCVFLYTPVIKILRANGNWKIFDHPNRWYRYAAWLLLAATAARMLFFSEAPPLLLPTAILGAVILFTLSSAVAPEMFIATLIFGLLIPTSSLYNAFLSYPLRIVSAEFSAFLLSLLNVPAVLDGTTITVGAQHIAITARCSGIEQVEGLLLGATLVTIFLHRNRFYRLLHFIMLLPLIILFNTIRLTITIEGWQLWGDVMLSPGVHRLLGIAMLIAVLGVFVLLGHFFPQEEDNRAKP